MWAKLTQDKQKFKCGTHSRKRVIYSRLQRDHLGREVPYRSCGDMTKGRFPMGSQSLPLPSCWIPKLWHKSTSHVRGNWVGKTSNMYIKVKPRWIRTIRRITSTWCLQAVYCIFCCECSGTHCNKSNCAQQWIRRAKLNKQFLNTYEHFN